MKYVLAFLTSVGFMGCFQHGRSVEDELLQRAVRAATPYKMTVCHVDPMFSESEYTKILNASSAVGIFTEYHQTFSVPQDVRFNNAAINEPCSVFKVLSTDRVVKKFEATRVPGQPMVLAFATGQRVYMISDRISDAEFFWVFTHELGHVMGLPDLKEEGHVMSGTGPFKGEWFDEEDHHICEIYRVCP